MADALKNGKGMALLMKAYTIYLDYQYDYKRGLISAATKDGRDYFQMMGAFSQIGGEAIKAEKKARRGL
jgi:hypothetical protein